MCELKSLSFAHWLISLKVQMFFSWMNKTLALPILAMTSASLPPGSLNDTAKVGEGFYFLKCCSLQGHWVFMGCVDLEDFSFSFIDVAACL